MKVGMTGPKAKMPQTIEEWKYLAGMYEKRMLSVRKEMGQLKHRLHNALQKLEKQHAKANNSKSR